MKTLFLILFITSIGFLTAQTFSLKTHTGGGFNTGSGDKTGETITVESKTFEVLITSSGSKYLECHSTKTGNDYPVWIGDITEFDFTYKEKVFPIRQSKSGKYFILVIGKSGQPYAKYLEENKES